MIVVCVEMAKWILSAQFLTAGFVLNGVEDIHQVVNLHPAGIISSTIAAGLWSADAVGTGILCGGVVVQEAGERKSNSLLTVPGELLTGAGFKTKFLARIHILYSGKKF